MHIVNLKHECGHRQEWVLPCAHDAGRRYGLVLAGEPCPRCAARAAASFLTLNLRTEYARTLCSREQPPETVPVTAPPRRRRAV